MAKFILDYYDSATDESYSDGDIESELLSYAKQGKHDWYKDGRWPIVYHLSHLRHNILNWFPFRPDCRILEIGAGCGALTGLLCERATKVTAVELTKRRAEINYYRHKEYENLDIVVCDFQRIPKEWKFDYVIINGVLEYAAYMVKSNQPHLDFLKIASQYMNEQGKMLLAIENRIGLKYFAGAKEDHTGQYFSGINGYVSGERVRTFSKQELTDLIIAAELTPLKYYYPYPDYKFPVEIFTDATVNNRVPSAPNYPFDMNRVMLFNEADMYREYMKSGIADVFSNSFLVEITSDFSLKPADIKYAKVSANRKEEYRIATCFSANLDEVYKKALTKQSEAHLAKMEHYSNYQYGRGKIFNVKGYQQEGRLGFAYNFAETMEAKLLASCLKGDIGEFNRHVINFKEALYEGSECREQPDSLEFAQLFGVRRCDQNLRWITNANVDMISANIFISNGHYEVIDYEWHIPFAIPQEYVLWRMLKQFVDDHLLQAVLTRPLLYQLIEIDESTEECFFEWETQFAREYVGIKDLHSLAQAVYSINIDQAVSQQVERNIIKSSLFFDLGEGYNASDIELKNAEYFSDGFAVTFTNEKLSKAVALRWDPLEGQAAHIRITRVETDGHVDHIQPINAEGYDEETGYEFFTFDPQFQITGNFSTASFLRISFTCKVEDWTRGYHQREKDLNEALNNSNRIQNELLNSINQTAEMQKKLKVSEEELNLTKATLQAYEDKLQHINLQMSRNRLKSIVKILLYGSIFRRKSNE